MADSWVSFPPFSLDLATHTLWREEQQCPVRPTPLAVLCYLVEHAGRVVSKAELLKALWPDTYVSDGVLKRHIKELRQVLGDDANASRYIETVPRRGYRFIAEVRGQPPAGNEPPSLQSPIPAAVPAPPSSTLVGREAELDFLHTCLEHALSGKRYIVFVTGEPGMGKTTLAREFTTQVTGMLGTSVGYGHCIEQYGAGEAYLPLLEALERLGREPEGVELITVLSRYAPTWLLQMPAVIADADLAAIQQRVHGVTQERMLREMARALEEFTTHRPLVLLLEDLQWSDYSTLDLLTVLAQRQEAARLLVIGTYRPADAVLSEHPVKTVKQDLQARGLCSELNLSALAQSHVEHYLSVRFDLPTEHASALQSLAQPIYQRTDGNPLFMVNMTEDLIDRGVVGVAEGEWILQVAPEDIIVEAPDTLRQMLLEQVERLSPDEQRLLEVASVVGADFSAAAVAVGLDADVEQVEEWCENLSQRGHFLHPTGLQTLPNGLLAGAYGFSHALYREALYNRLSDVRRLRLHRKIGEGVERAYGERSSEIAAELSMHFERGQDYARAVRYHRQAGENALRKHAPREALGHFETGLKILSQLPDTPGRAEQELRLQTALSVPVMILKGNASAEMETIYTRARALCRQVGETPELFTVLYGLTRLAAVRGDFQTAREIGEQLLRLAQTSSEPELLLEAHASLGAVLFFSGEFSAARAQFEQGISLYDPPQHHALAFQYGEDPGLLCHAYGAWTLWFAGYPDQASALMHKALSLAEEFAYPQSQLASHFCAAVLGHLCSNGPSFRTHAQGVQTVAATLQSPQWTARGIILNGWAAAQRGQAAEGIRHIRDGLAACRKIDSELYRPYFLALLSESHIVAGQADQALTSLTEAIAYTQEKGECYYAAELYRLRGESLLMQANHTAKVTLQRSELIAESEAFFQQAVEIARSQAAKSLELRAVMSLAKVWSSQAKQQQAYQLLSSIYERFTEGFETADLQQAKRLLADWA